MPTKHTPTVLLIEDNAGDADLVRYLFSGCGRAIDLHVAEDGVEGADFLFRRGQYAMSPTPDLVLLDLNLPRKNGRELLKELKADENLASIPVILLSSSNNPRDVSSGYAVGASAFICKPVDLEDYQRVIQQIVDFWFGIVELPQPLPSHLRIPAPFGEQRV